jgi:DNA polymerase I
VIGREGYEADDIIGSIAHEHQNDEYQIVIISSDKDLCQFVRDGHVHIFDAMKRKFMKESDVLEKFAVPVHQVRDYLAIVGDSSDNIPGIKGFGPKKAESLLSTYGTLENIYAHIDELPTKMQEILNLERENAFLSQKLATIVTDLDIDEHEFLPFREKLQSKEYLELLKKYEFRSLIPKDAFLVQKTTLDLPIEDIASDEALSKFLDTIKNSKDPLTIATSIDETLVL